MKKTEHDLKDNFPVSDLWETLTVKESELDVVVVMAETEKTMET